MSNRIMRAAFLLCFCLTSVSSVSAAPAKRNITEKDLFDFVWLGDPQVSPDGAGVAYVRVTVNEKKDGYDTSIWIVPTAGDQAPRQLTSGPHDAGPRWSPDGKWLVFSRAV
jgi:dipeptidyl aminopeptidase/acylaminoacyl peptidase